MSSEELLKLDVPVHDRRSGPALNLRIEVYRNGSLEAAGRRAALFTRLVDEFSIANIQKLTGEKRSSYKQGNGYS
jgi:hypothetical protein